MLVITEDQRKQIESEALARYPNECCGVLVGRERDGDRVITSLIPMPNASAPAEQHHRFAIDPKHLIRAESEAGARGDLVLGFYHSHPDHPADPSETDRTCAWPFYSYLIVSVRSDGAGQLKSWQFDEELQQFLPQQLRIVPPATGRKDQS